MIYTAEYFLVAFAYGHFIFFAPLIFVFILYDIFFLLHKIVPGRDNHDSRRVLFLLMVLLMMLEAVYGLLFAN